MKRSIRSLIVVGLLIVSNLFIVGCDINNFFSETKEYTVTFNVMYENASNIEVLVEDGSFVQEQQIIREGYTLLGWYSDSTYNFLFNFVTPVTGNLNLYAKWFEEPLSEPLSESFGLIVCDEIPCNCVISSIINYVIMPGDDIDVEFSLENASTADLYIRFQLLFTGVGATGISDITGDIDGFTRTDFGADGYWYVKDTELVNETAGGLNVVAIDEVFEIATSVNGVEGDSLEFLLKIKTVQAANNGISVFDCQWPE